MIPNNTEPDADLPAHVRDTITAVVADAGDLEQTPIGSGALTVQVCSASELSHDPATWTAVGTYAAADAALLADRLVDALGESANLGTDAGVLVVTHTYTDTQERAMHAPGADAPPLLTLHPDRVDELDGSLPDPAGNDSTLRLQQHWLLQSALASGVITYDRNTWGDLALSASFTGANRHEITFQITYDIEGAPNVCDGAETDYPDNYNELDTAAQDAFPSTLVPDPPTALGWLTYIVAALNDLHQRTADLVRGWPH